MRTVVRLGRKSGWVRWGGGGLLTYSGRPRADNAKSTKTRVIL